MTLIQNGVFCTCQKEPVSVFNFFGEGRVDSACKNSKSISHFVIFWLDPLALSPVIAIKNCVTGENTRVSKFPHSWGFGECCKSPPIGFSILKAIKKLFGRYIDQLREKKLIETRNKYNQTLRYQNVLKNATEKKIH